jgi:hypothetical protein
LKFAIKFYERLDDGSKRRSGANEIGCSSRAPDYMLWVFAIIECFAILHLMTEADNAISLLSWVVTKLALGGLGFTLFTSFSVRLTLISSAQHFCLSRFQLRLSEAWRTFACAL